MDLAGLKRVMVVDDNADFGRMLKSTIEADLDCKVTLFEDGDEGLRFLADNAIDLVITDLLMPGKEGLELIMDIKKQFPKVKVFAVSGGGQFDPRCPLDIAEKLGARGFYKPLSMGRFISNLKDALFA